MYSRGRSPREYIKLHEGYTLAKSWYSFSMPVQRIHNDGSALGCLLVHWDHGSALGSWECTGMRESAKGCIEGTAVMRVGRVHELCSSFSFSPPTAAALLSRTIEM